MKKTRAWVGLTVLVAVTLGTISALAGPRDGSWKKVDEAVKKGLPKTAVEHLETPTGLDAMSPKQALIIGGAQCAAFCPGVSRSLATILGARAAGLSLAAAVEFSFILGAVTLSAATGYELLDCGVPICVPCGYPLIGLPGPNCPECGRPFDEHVQQILDLKRSPPSSK